MNPDRYRRLRDIFAATCDLARAQRAEFLDVVCSGDAMLRAEVEALLAQDEESGSLLEDSPFIITPVLEVGAKCFRADSVCDPGDQFGPYRIDREIGAGGQGVVYLAEDVRQGRKVALKVLSLAARVHPQFLQRFKREAQTAGRLGHPGICRVYATDVEDGLPYIAMQYVEGETLASRLSAACDGRGRFDPMRAVAIIETAARAVHAAHEAGVIHRDLKPANIMVTPDGEPVVLDFGLARDERSAVTLTNPGDVFGTPAYMAPEQVDPQIGFVDRRTDVYALGVTLYEGVTLHQPFEAGSRESLYREILTGSYSDPRRYCPDVPRGLRVVLATALARAQNRRYQTARDLAEDLARVHRGQPIVARPTGPLRRLLSWTRRNPGLVAIVAAILLVQTGVFAVTVTLLQGTSHSGAEFRCLAALRTLGHLKRITDEELWPVLTSTVP